MTTLTLQPRDDMQPLTVPRTLGTLLDLYAQEYLPHQAPNTQKRKRSQFRLFRRTLGDVPLEDLSPQRLRAWRDALPPHYKPGTVVQHMDALSSVLRVAVEDYEWLRTNPMHKVQAPRLPDERVRFLDAEEQGRLLGACRRSPCPFLYPLVVLAMTTGARKMECLMLRWADVDLDQRVIRLERTKTRLRRGVPLPSMTRTILQTWRTQVSSPYVFPGTKAQPPDINRRWYWARDRAGLVDFRFHDLRHTAASYLAMSGVRIEVIADILGHRSIQTTRRYAHLSPAYTAELVEKMAQQFIRP